MPTEVLRTVGAGGTGADYPDFSTWQAALQEDLQAADKNMVVECIASSVNDAVNFSGWNTEPGTGHTIEIRPQAGSEHNGVFFSQGGGGFEWSGSGSFAGVTERGITVRGIEIFGNVFSGSVVELHAVGTPAGSAMLFDELIISNPSSNTASYLIFGDGNCAILTLRNSLLKSPGRALDTRNTFNSETFDNITVNCGTFGLLGGSTSFYQNCISYGSASGDFYQPTAGNMSNCSSGDASAVGANAFNGIVDADFIDPANDDYNVVPGNNADGAVNPGLDLSGTFADDITGAPRAVPWERGAYELPGGAPPGAELEGSATGVSTLVGALAISVLLAGSTAGGSAIFGDLSTAADDLSGLLSGTSTLTGDLDSFPAGEALQGTIDGTSALVGDLDIAPAGEALQGTINGTSTASADLTAAPAGLSGAIFATSTLAGDLDAFAGLTGSLAGTSTASASLSTAATLAGTIAGQSVMWGTLASDLPPRVPVSLDLSPFFQSGEFSQPALLNAVVPFQAIFTDYYNQIIGGSIGLTGTEPLVIAQHEEIPDVVEGDTVQIDTWVWTVREVAADNTGIVRLKLEQLV